MRITKEALDIIRSSVENISVETGGIMGSQNKNFVSDIIMDIPKNNEFRCYYMPNVKYFNECIAKWNQQNKYFLGMFHTHFYNIESLSKEDIKYINIIMGAMPNGVDRLFFPIYTLPQHKMICYAAMRYNDTISITNDMLEIV